MDLTRFRADSSDPHSEGISLDELPDLDLAAEAANATSEFQLTQD